MSKPFDNLKEQLLRAGVSPRHVHRYLREVTEHFQDLVVEIEREGHARQEAEAMAMVRMGRVDDLARAMIDQRCLQSWNRRAPWATLMLAPCLVFAGIVAVSVVLLSMTGQALKATALFPWFPGIAGMVTGFSNFILPIMCGWGIAAIAIRQRLQPAWPVIGLAAMALLGSMTQLNVVMPSGPGVSGAVMLGFSLYSSTAFYLVLNLALTLVPYLAWRRWMPVLRPAT